MDGDLDSGTVMATQHDRIFKQLLRAFLTDFVRLVLPQASDRLDLSSPVFLDKAWAFAALMDPGSWSRAELKVACLRRITGLRSRIDPFLLADCVENCLQLEPREVAEFDLLTARRENQEVRAVKLTWSETLREEGREEGLAEGAQKVLLLLLGKRFGPLPENVCRRVEAIDSLDLLTRLAERLLSAHSLEEMGLA